VRGKRELNERELNLSETGRLSLKKSSKLDRQISLKVLIKFALKFVHFAWTKVNES
jgi:hypothetical protein